MKRFLAIVLILTSMLALCACTPKQEAKFLGTWTDDLGNTVLILEQDGSVFKATFNDGTVYNWEMAPQPEMDYGQPIYEVLYDTINFFEYEDRAAVDTTQPTEAPEATETPEATEAVEGEETETTEEPEATEATEPVEEATEVTEAPEATEAAEGEETEATEPAEEPETTEAPEATEATEPAVDADEAEKTPLLTAKLVIKGGKMMLVLTDATGKEICLLYKTAKAA